MFSAFDQSRFSVVSSASQSCFSRPNSILSAKPCMARKSTTSIQSMCKHTLFHTLSFLAHEDVVRLGMTCKDMNRETSDGYLWMNVAIRDNKHIDSKVLSDIISKTTAKHPLTSLSLHNVAEPHVVPPAAAAASDAVPDQDGSAAPAETEAVEATSEPSPVNNAGLAGQLGEMFNEREVTAHVDSALPPASASVVVATTAVPTSGDRSSCNTCFDLLDNVTKSHFKEVQYLYLSEVHWLNPCSLHLMISNTSVLQTIVIHHNVDVNYVMTSLSNACPLLKQLYFSYVSASTDDTMSADVVSSPSALPVLQSAVAQTFARKCALVTTLFMFNNCVDDESVVPLLQLPHVSSCNLSMNDSLHGYFLPTICAKWRQIESIVLRDCVELDSEPVEMLVDQLFQSTAAPGPECCPHLTCLDFSCQWEYTNRSILSRAYVEKVRKLTGMRQQFHWYEDHCQDNAVYGSDDEPVVGEEESVYDFPMDEEMDADMLYDSLVRGSESSVMDGVQAVPYELSTTDPTLIETDAVIDDDDEDLAYAQGMSRYAPFDEPVPENGENVHEPSTLNAAHLHSFHQMAGKKDAGEAAPSCVSTDSSTPGYLESKNANDATVRCIHDLYFNTDR